MFYPIFSTWRRYLCVVLITFLISIVTSLPEVIKIGGIFDIDDDEQELAFRYAIDRINTDNSILPKSRLSLLVERVAPDDSFHAFKIVCDFLRIGVAAIFGPRSPFLCNTIQSVCKQFEVPNVYMWWDVGYRSYRHSINIYPEHTALTKACLDLIKTKRWKKFTIIYESNEDLLSYQDLLTVQNSYEDKVTIRKLPQDVTYRKLLKETKRSGERNIVLIIPVEKIMQVLRDAQEIGLLTEYHNFVVTSLDFHTLDLKEFNSVRSNITAFRLVDPSKYQVANVIRDWIFGELRYGRRVENKKNLKTNVALLYDAILLFSRALQDLDRSQPIQIHPIDCSASAVTSYGRSVVGYMKMINIDGLTGDIKFNENGGRDGVTLDIVEVHRGIVIKVGIWNTKTGVNYTRELYSEYGDILQILRNKTLRVTTIVHPPYVMERTNSGLKGNDRFKGFCIDLIKEISKIFGFRYEITLVRDNKYGNDDGQGKWNGIVRQLVDMEADLAVADLTITSERERVIDFSTPFMTTGISILFRSDREESHWFTFLSPLSIEVWIAIATTYLTVSFVLYVIARFTPYEWVRRRQNEPQIFVLENQFNFSTSIWFTLSSFTQQGSLTAPRALSTRVLATIWWFFTLITLSSYTANLAAFITAERMISPILSVEDLEKQPGILFGCMEKGSTEAFFKTSSVPIYKRLWWRMESIQPTIFTKTTEEGIQRVLNENYVFFMESASIEYITQNHCNLLQTGGLLNSIGYGIATPHGSPYLQLLSKAILKLQEKGVLQVLKHRWWKIRERKRCAHVSHTVSPTSVPSEFHFGNIGGVFILLIAGIGISFIVFLIEYTYNRRIQQQTQKISKEFTESQL